MTPYIPSLADRAPLPRSCHAEPRYLGYRDSDTTRPFAKYFRDCTEPIQDHVRYVLLGGMSPPEYGYDIDDAPRMLGRPGHQRMETGWTRLDNGVTLICCRTEMPAVTAAMWDWWFGWFGVDTARYKLWYPDAHLYSGLGHDRSGERSLTDRQRYVGNVGYVDEYIGGVLHRLAIRFVDPGRLGFEDAPDITHICARVGLSRLPLLVGWLIHQVRPTDEGAEMRSRFFLNHPEVIDVASGSAAGRVFVRGHHRRFANAVLPFVARTIGHRLAPASIGYDVLFHCASEMNHLAGFLPTLYEEFRGTP